MNERLHIYTQALKRAYPLLLLAVAIIAISSYLVARSFGPTYEVHYSYLVAQTTRDTTPDYRFDGYYALQATDVFAATLAGWTHTPEVIEAAATQAGLENIPQDSRALQQLVTAEKTAPQLVQVTVRGATAAQAQHLTTTLQAVMQKNIDDYRTASMPAVQFKVVTGPAWVGQNQLHAGIIAISAAIATAFLAINGVIFFTALKHS